MRVISKRTLTEFWESDLKHAVARPSLEAWYAEAKIAEWRSPADIKAKYKNASILKNGRVVFNIKGNDYRLIVHIHYESQIIYICWIGTHRDYDDEDAETVHAPKANQVRK